MKRTKILRAGKKEEISGATVSKEIATTASVDSRRVLLGVCSSCFILDVGLLFALPEYEYDWAPGACPPPPRRGLAILPCTYGLCCADWTIGRVNKGEHRENEVGD